MRSILWERGRDVWHDLADHWNISGGTALHRVSMFTLEKMILQNHVTGEYYYMNPEL